MSGPERAFDDGRFPDLDGHADCFLCGRKMDPNDPRRGSYTPNNAAFDGLPMHLPCVDEVAHGDPLRLQVLALAALTTMTEANAKRLMRNANCVGATSH